MRSAPRIQELVNNANFKMPSSRLRVDMNLRFHIS